MMDAKLPALPQSEYRAFMLLSVLPDGCFATPVIDGTGAPHLRMGEFAIVDPSDTAPRSGEVYLVQWQSGRRAICSIKAHQSRFPDGHGECPVELWIGAAAFPWRRHNAPALTDREAFALLRRYGSNDGPIVDMGYLESKLVGRVVGIFAAESEGPMLDVTPTGGEA